MPSGRQMDAPSRLTVFAMTSKGLAVLATLLADYPGLVAAVVVGRDTSIENDHADEIIALCDRHATPVQARAAEFRIETSHALAVSWRWMIEPGTARLIVVHDSLLPRHRGFNPLVTALIEGDAAIGVTALYASSEYDRGDIIAQVSIPVEHPIRIADAIALACGCYRDLAMRIGDWLAGGIEPPALAQDESVATYSLWRDDDDYEIDWTLDAARIERTVHALGPPYRGASTWVAGRKARVGEVAMVPDVVIANRTPGKVIFMDHGRPVVVCGTGLLRIDGLVDAKTGKSFLPLARFRTRFGAR